LTERIANSGNTTFGIATELVWRKVVDKSVRIAMTAYLVTGSRDQAE
jgi:hypothetical protein